MDTTNTVDKERYARQIMLPEIGTEGQMRLARARVLVVGLGGLGAPVSTYLAAAGVGRLGLCDNDVVSLSNLQRQVLYTTADLEKPKARCAGTRLEAINPTIEIQLHTDGLTPDNAETIVGRYDLVMDCTDNFTTRYLIDDVCARLMVPWVHGAIGEFAGEVSAFGLPPHPRRFAELFPDREALSSLPRTVRGVMGAVPGVIGAMQACEAIKIITKCGNPLSGRLFTINLLDYQTETINF